MCTDGVPQMMPWVAVVGGSLDLMFHGYLHSLRCMCIDCRTRLEKEIAAIDEKKDGQRRKLMEMQSAFAKTAGAGAGK